MVKVLAKQAEYSQLSETITTNRHHQTKNHSLIRLDPQTIADDQDLDILNLHKEDVK